MLDRVARQVILWIGDVRPQMSVDCLRAAGYEVEEAEDYDEVVSIIGRRGEQLDLVLQTYTLNAGQRPVRTVPAPREGSPGPLPGSVPLIYLDVLLAYQGESNKRRVDLGENTYVLRWSWESQELLTSVETVLDQTRETLYLQDQVPSVFRVRLAEANDQLLRYLASHPQYMYQLRPELFENVVARILSDMGYEVELTRPSKDGGIDIIATRTDWAGSVLLVGECKGYGPGNHVGIGIVQRLEGVASGMRADIAMLATTSFFTREAQEWQQRSVGIRLSLRDFNDLQTLLSSYRG